MKSKNDLDEAVRNTVEGCFGVAKRRYKLDRIFKKIKGSSESLIALVFMVMNLEKTIVFIAAVYFSIINTFRRITRQIHGSSLFMLFKTLVIQ